MQPSRRRLRGEVPVCVVGGGGGDVGVTGSLVRAGGEHELVGDLENGDAGRPVL